MDRKIIEILEKIKLKYQDIDTILLFGSAATSDWTPDSDIDVFLIDDKFHDSREDLIIDDVQIEIQQDNFSNLTKDIENERGRLNNRNVATMIDGSIIIKTNSENNVQDLKSLAESVLQSTPTFTDEDVKMWRYSIDDYLSKAEKDLKRGDTIAFYFDTNYVIQNATELTLATHGAYFPQPKRLADLLQQIAPEFHDILQSFTTEPNLDNKLKILQKLKTL
ncbi:nucleotidyltransferase domain-containing protein [Candidatus Saccharibacteria bacterium]|nr:nucleotidyltransferase domain-containing protein [Candidatus Saccharibacteria bacterium]